MEPFKNDSRNINTYSNNSSNIYNINTNENNVDEIIKAFQYFDMNNIGQININELKGVLTSFGNKMSEEEFEKIIKSFNINLDNKDNVNYFEFLNILENNK